MKDSLQTGLKTDRTFSVDRDSTIGFMGEEGRVYATPALVRDIENTCRDFLKQHLDDSEDSVGARVEIDHLAPTLEGMDVHIHAEIVDIDGRLVTFEASARDDLDDIGKCTHKRFIVDIDKTAERLRAKAQKAGKD